MFVCKIGNNSKQFTQRRTRSNQRFEIWNMNMKIVNEFFPKMFLQTAQVQLVNVQESNHVPLCQWPSQSEWSVSLWTCWTSIFEENIPQMVSFLNDAHEKFSNAFWSGSPWGSAMISSVMLAFNCLEVSGVVSEGPIFEITPLVCCSTTWVILSCRNDVSEVSYNDGMNFYSFRWQTCYQEQHEF